VIIWCVNKIKKACLCYPKAKTSSIRLVSFLQRDYPFKFNGYNLSLLQHPLWDGGKSTK